MVLYVHGLIVLVDLRLLLVGCSLAWLGLMRVVHLSVVCGLFLGWWCRGVLWCDFVCLVCVSDSVCLCLLCSVVLSLVACYDCCRFGVF